MMISGTGAVGIGTTLPSARLEVTATSGALLALTTTTSGDRMVVTATGSVGIGTGSPQYRVDVLTATTTAVEAFSIHDSSGYGIIVSPRQGASAWTGLQQSNDQSIIFRGTAVNTGSLVIAPWSNYAYGLRITSTGGTGVNTATPSQALDVNGNINVTTATGQYMIGNVAVLALPVGDTTSVAVGESALTAQSATNSYNTAVGNGALALTTGGSNTAVGTSALQMTTTGGSNTAVGVGALQNNSTGSANVALGRWALLNNTGSLNVAVGNSAAQNKAAGNTNTALGALALYGNTATASWLTGSGNTAIGYTSLYNVQTSSTKNTALGTGALSSLTTGSNNIGIGADVASTTLTTGSNNILIGTSSAVDTPSASTSNWLNIGNTIYGNLSTHQVGIGNGLSAVSTGAILDLGGGTGTALSSMILPKDTTANRPTTGLAGMLRYNTTNTAAELYNGSSWSSLLTSSSTNISTYLGASATQTNPSRSGEVTTGLFSDASGNVAVSSLGTEVLRVTASGSVGIGNASPGTVKLFVAADGTESSPQMILSGQTNSLQRMMLGYNTASDYGYIQPLIQGTGYENLVLNKSGGNVGIGTASPAQKLDVYGNVNMSGATSRTIFYGTTGVAAPGASSVGEKIQLYGTAGTIGTSDYALGIESSHMWFNSGGGFKWYKGSSQNMILTTTGAVGIGTSTPSQRLDVNGNVNVTTATGDYMIGNVTVMMQPAGDTTSFALGQGALQGQSTTGLSNIAVGASALAATTTGFLNVAVGGSALPVNSTGYQNNAFGYGAMLLTTTGHGNNAFGTAALRANSGGSGNSAFGQTALYKTIGDNNTGVGIGAGYNITSGVGNTAVGAFALFTGTASTTGNYNTVMGYAVGSTTLVTGSGSSNILIGNSSAVDTPTSSTSNWMNIGGVLYGDLANGYVGIGATATAPAYPLDVVGNANFSGYLGVGSAGPNSTRGINLGMTASNINNVGLYTSLGVVGTLSANRSNYGTYTLLTSSADNTSYTNTLYGNWNQVTNSAGTGYNAAYGSYNYIVNSDTSLTNATSIGAHGYINNASTGTLTTAEGVYGLTLNNAGGTITNGYGLQGYTRNASTGSVGTAYGINAMVVNDSYGTITTAYGGRDFVRNDEGTLTTAYGNYAHIQQATATGSIGTSYAYYARLDRDAGTMGTGYLYYGAFEGTHTTKWGLYLTGEDNNYLSGNLGIGTSTPSVALDVAGDANVSGTLTVGTLSLTSLSLTTATITNLFASTATITAGVVANLVSTTATLGTIYSTNLTASTATIGTIANTSLTSATATIGTIANTSLTSATATITTLVTANLTSTTATIATLRTTGVHYLADGSAAAPSLAFTADTNTGLYRPGNDMLGFTTGGVEAMRITATNSVGIGTTTPIAALDVLGNINLSGNVGIASATPVSTRAVNLGFTATNTNGTGIYNVFNVTGSFGASRANYGNYTLVTNTATNNAYTNTMYGAWNQITNSDGTDFDTAYGGYNYVVNNDTTSTSGTGIGSFGYILNASTATLTTGKGSYGEVVNNSGGVIGTAVGAEGFAYNISTGTIGTAQGVYSQVINDSSGTITTAFGTNNYMRNDEGTIATAYGNYTWIRQATATGSIGTAYANYARLDQDAGTMGTGYLYYGVFEGTQTTKYGLYLSGETTDYLSGNLGIGTTTPEARLQIVSGTDASLSGGGQIILGSTSGTNLAFDENEIMARNNGAAATLYLQSDGGSTLFANNLTSTDRVIITASGSVGIGLITPTVALDVLGDAKISGALTAGSITLTSLSATTATITNLFATTATIATLRTTGVHYLADGSAAAPSLSFTADTNTGLFRAGTDALGFATAGTEAMRITATNSVGINTTLPSQALGVKGNIDIATATGSFMINGDTVLARPAGDISSIAAGVFALASQSVSGLGNVAVGYNALNQTTTGVGNVGIGNYAGASNTTGINNTSMGNTALRSNTTGNNNVALGAGALYHNTTGSGNTVVGGLAMYATATFTGGYNTVLGYNVGRYTLLSGSNNILIGTSSEVDTPTSSTSNWMDIGGVLYGDLANGYVGIGATATAPAYPLDVVGNANFSGVLGVGSLVPNSGRGINLGMTASNASDIGVYSSVSVVGTLSANRTNYGTYSVLTSSADNTSFSNTLYGSWNQVTNSAGTGYNTAYGSYNYVLNNDTSLTNATSVGTIGYVNNASTGTLTSAYGVYGIVNNALGGTIGTGDGAYIYLHNTSTGTITNGYAIYAQTINDSTGTIGSAFGTRDYVRNDEGAITTAYGDYSWINQATATGSIGTSYAYYARLDQDAGTMGTGYLYYGVYQGTHTTKYGIYLSGETTNYLSGSLGIGTSTPSVALDVSGDANVSGALTVGSLSLTSLSVTTATIGTLHSSGITSSTATIGTIANTSLTSSTATIGTIASSNLTSATATISTLVTANLTSTTATIATLRTTGVLYLADGSAAAPSLAFTADTNTGLYRVTTDTLGFATAGTEAMRITATNSVGIGTSSPAQKLDVYGNVNMSGATSRTIFYGTTGVAAPGASSVGEKLQLYGTAGTVTTIDYALGIESSHMWFNSGGGFKWYKNSSQVMILTTTGAVGIGTSTPSQLLDVDGNINVTTATGDYMIKNVAVLSQPVGDTTSIAVGQGAMVGQTAVDARSTAIGVQALASQVGTGTAATWQGNTAVGYQALYATTTGYGNVGVGISAGAETTTGYNNTAVGNTALSKTVNGAANTALGAGALYNNTTGGFNTVIGALAVYSTATFTGSHNTIIGNEVGRYTLLSGSNNILIGTSSDVDTPTASTSNWMNIGGVLYGNLSSGYVGIGATATAPAYPLDVVGNANFSGVLGVGTANPSSTRGINLALTSSNTTSYGQVNALSVVGTLTAARNNYAVYNAVTSTADNTSYTNSLFGTWNAITNSAGTGYNAAYGTYNYVLNNDTSLTNATSYGAYNYVKNASSGTLTTVAGSLGYAYNASTGTITTAEGTVGQVINDTTGTIGSAYGAYNYVRNDEGTMTTAVGNYVWVRQTTTGGDIGTAFGNYVKVGEEVGTIDTAYLYYGVYSGSPTTKWGLYLSGESNNYLSGNLGIGTSTPGYALDVVGQVRSTGAVSGFQLGDRSSGGQSIYYRTASITHFWDNSAGDVISYTSTGSVGIDTTTPAYALDVAGTAGANALVLDGSDSTAYLRLTASGSTTYIESGTSLTSGSTAPILFTNMYATGNLMSITGTASVGIGTAAPIAPLSVVNGTTLTTSTGTAAMMTMFQSNGNNNMVSFTHRRHTAGSTWTGTNVRLQRTIDTTAMGFIDFGIDGLSSNMGLGFGTGSTTRMVLTASSYVGIANTTPSYPLQIGTSTADGSGAFLSAAGVWTNASDRRIKENIEPLTYGTETLMKLKPVRYDMKRTHEKQIGFIAQDVGEVVPEVVSVDDHGWYGLSYGNLLAVSVKAQQEMKAVNDNQEARLARLEKENEELRARLVSLPSSASPEPDRLEPKLRLVLYLGGGLALALLAGLAGCGLMIVRLRREMRTDRARKAG
jgi:hypothetical protein